MTDKTYGPDKLTIGQMHSNKKDAFAVGHSHYFTGATCIYGHIIPRRTINTRCQKCETISSRKRYISSSRRKMTNEEKSERSRAYYYANREELLQQKKEYRAANKISQQNRAYYLRKKAEKV